MTSRKKPVQLNASRPGVSSVRAPRRRSAKGFEHEAPKPKERLARSNELASTLLALSDDLPFAESPDDVVLLEEAEEIDLPEIAAEITEAAAEGGLAQVDEALLDDEVLEVRRPEVVAELGEDPVRLYLREIGEVKLLDSDSEFRLATLIEARRQIGTFLQRPVRKGTLPAVGGYRSLLSELVTSWNRFMEDAKRLNKELPDLCLMVVEAQSLHNGWQSSSRSYLRGYLSNDRWGHDTLWDSMVRKAYTVFLCLYLLPAGYAEWLAQSYQDLPRAAGPGHAPSKPS